MSPQADAGSAAKTNPVIVFFSSLAYLGGFLLSLMLVLVAFMDMRKGFLFSSYFLKTAWINLHPHQLWMLLMGVTGALVCYRLLRNAEGRGEMNDNHRRVLANVTAVALFAALSGTLIVLIRGLGMVRVLHAGKMSIGALGLSQALPGKTELIRLDSAPYLLKPLAITVNYLSLVWDATIVGILLAGLTVTAIPIYFNRFLEGGRAGTLRQLLGGVIYGIPQPFCSCCASPIAATLYKSTGSVAASVAFLLTSPTLNFSTLILAAALLPAPYAVVRIAGGILFVIAIALLAARLGEKGSRAGEAPHAPPGAFFGLLTRLFNRYCNLFHFEAAGQAVQAPAGLISSWLTNSWREFKVVYPTMIAGGLVAGAIVTFFPAVFSNDAAGVIRSAVLGTLLMVGTWTEIPVASVLAGQGLSGPAAALLVTLPTVSLPCLLIFGGALRSARLTLLLGLATCLFGVLAGLAFLVL